MDAQEKFRRLAQGQRCRALIAQAYEHQGELVEEANVLFLQTDDAGWLRFFFDCGYFFLHQEEEPSYGEFAADDFRLIPVDFGVQHQLVDRRIASVDFAEFHEGAELRIVFDGGAVLVLRNADDHSTVSITSPVA